MNSDKILIKYQENFADNLTSYAYGKIAQENCGAKCCYENKTSSRTLFEEKMSHFDLDYSYISSLRVEDIVKDALKLNDKFDYKNKKKYQAIERKLFNPNDIKYLNEQIKKEISFKNLNFIKSYDILEKITKENSIGLYINSKDAQNDAINYLYIEKAIKRLNKYIKKPKLYIFSSAKLHNKIKSCVDYEFLDIADWKEEYYFLSKCKHKIILNSPNSYSVNFWASILNEKDYFYITLEKNRKLKNKKKNWLIV